MLLFFNCYFDHHKCFVNTVIEFKTKDFSLPLFVHSIYNCILFGKGINLKLFSNSYCVASPVYVAYK